MTDPHHYLDEIRDNMAKLQGHGIVSPTEKALFGMIDGLAGMLRVTLERVTVLERVVAQMQRRRKAAVEAKKQESLANQP